MFCPVAQPICLPDPAQAYVNVSTVVTGWGRTNGDPKVPRHDAAILQEDNLNTISNSKCEDGGCEEFKPNITENMICAVNTNEAPCKGDNGGPMITLGKNGTYQQIGIVSFIGSVGICSLESPNVFSRVTVGLEWINAMIKRQ